MNNIDNLINPGFDFREEEKHSNHLKTYQRNYVEPKSYKRKTKSRLPKYLLGLERDYEKIRQKNYQGYRRVTELKYPD